MDESEAYVCCVWVKPVKVCRGYLMTILYPLSGDRVLDSCQATARQPIMCLSEAIKREVLSERLPACTTEGWDLQICCIHWARTHQWPSGDQALQVINISIVVHVYYETWLCHMVVLREELNVHRGDLIFKLHTSDASLTISAIQLTFT